jgi:hypothetical protein
MHKSFEVFPILSEDGDFPIQYNAVSTDNTKATLEMSRNVIPVQS